jgi:hypothetical protein
MNEAGFDAFPTIDGGLRGEDRMAGLLQNGRKRTQRFFILTDKQDAGRLVRGMSKNISHDANQSRLESLLQPDSSEKKKLK